MRICFATNNTHKVAEVQAVLGPAFQLTGPKNLGFLEELPELGDTLEANSFQKANYIFTYYHVPCFADDSGLVVSALNGRPGVDSAHYAGPQRSFTDNVNLLLKNMEGKEDRTAQFETVITFVQEGLTRQFKGIIQGTITASPRGSGGFGYDPVFLPNGSDRTFAEMSADEKNAISHRARAVEKLAGFLKSSFLQE